MVATAKIGVGITTHNRETAFRKCLASIPRHKIDVLYVVNDATPYLPDAYVGKDINEVIQNTENLGVGKSKNILLKKMMDAGCDYLFLVEDDMEVINDSVFDEYIKASKVTGIGLLNSCINEIISGKDDARGPRMVLAYPGEVEIALYFDCMGQFSLFSRRVIERVGYMDESFHNCWEHIDHALNIMLAGFHPPLMWFADVADSQLLVRPQVASISIDIQTPEYKKKRDEAELWLRQKYGIFPYMQEFDTDKNRLMDVLDFLKNTPNTPEHDAVRQQVLSMHLLITHYCAGTGIELGRSSHNYFGLRNSLNVAPSDGVHYLYPQDIEDYQKHAQIQTQYGLSPAPVDKIGDTRNIPFEANSQDYVLCSHIFEYEPNPIAALVEISRVLRENEGGTEGCFALLFSRDNALSDGDYYARGTLHEFVSAYIEDRRVDKTNPPGGWRGHYYTWSLQDWLGLINWCNNQRLTCFCVDAFEETESVFGEGQTLILRKMSPDIMKKFDFGTMIASYINSGQYEGALLSAKIGLSFNFFQPEVLYAAAMLFAQMNKPLEAREFYRQSLILNPDNEAGKQEFFELFARHFEEL